MKKSNKLPKETIIVEISKDGTPRYISKIIDEEFIEVQGVNPPRKAFISVSFLDHYRILWLPNKQNDPITIKIR